MSKQVREDRVQLYCDSRLVVSQITGEFEAKDHKMINYLKEVRILKYQFKEVEILHISRGNNNHADSLATLASSVADPLPRIMSVELLPCSRLTLSNKDLVLNIYPSSSSMDPILAYLRNGILPKDKKESEKVRSRSS